MNNLPSLDQIAIKHETDKSSLHHGYCKYYEMFLAPIRNNPVVLWEIGYGGYEFHDRGGEGARTWREYFPNGTIVSVDVHPKTNLPPGVIFRLLPAMEGQLDTINTYKELVNRYGQPDIIIDDADHRNTNNITRFHVLFPMLKKGGLWVTEDIESSWWEEPASDGVRYHGCADPNNMTASTTVNLFRRLINDVNARHISGWEAKYGIESIHFFDNIVFVRKK
jgi:hypothetical protein